MKWKIIIAVVVIVLAAATVWFYASTTKIVSQKTYHVGFLSGVPIFDPIVDGFKAGMSKRGYVEGKDIVYDVQKLVPNPDAYQKALQKFIADKDDLIVVVPTEPSLMAKSLTKGAIPIVFAADLEGVDLVDSVQNPGNNMTGVRIDGVDSVVERIKLMSEIVPHARVYAPYDKSYPISAAAMAQARAEAAKAGLTLVEVPVTTADEVIADIAKRESSKDIGVDAVITTPSPLLAIPPASPAIIAFALRHKLPIAGGYEDAAHDKTLYTTLPKPDEQGDIMAVQADKIFHGVPAGTIPVSTPTLHLVVNDKIAQSLGITLQETFLSKAETIIK